ncbi:MAG TPA: SUF system NifU family Fe-S cluster assembly protein [Gemmatimonadales bacterium]|jgi:nitrogen fixation NifU-like protein|nr:SUF system NifU family Fe-S cluster assembly protein [Gemmatimonadales bacterium]
MSAVSALYQDLILDHNRSPRNYGAMANANRRVEGDNPLCGDRLTVWLLLDGDRVRDVSFEASGCAISVASASLMTSAIKGKTKAEAEHLFEQFHRLVTGELDPLEAHTLGKLAVFSGVREYPVRVKCASLSWHAMKAALQAPAATVTT